MNYTSHSRWYKEKNYELRLKRLLRRDRINTILGWIVVIAIINIFFYWALILR
jgi:hypothetical protein